MSCHFESRLVEIVRQTRTPKTTKQNKDTQANLSFDTKIHTVFFMFRSFTTFRYQILFESQVLLNNRWLVLDTSLSFEQMYV